MIHWQGGLAEVVEVKGATITVQCPHCDKQHQHGRQMLGSRNVVAGCHAGPRRLREYRIPQGAQRVRPTRQRPAHVVIMRKPHSETAANDSAEVNPQVSTRHSGAEPEGQQ